MTQLPIQARLGTFAAATQSAQRRRRRLRRSHKTHAKPGVEFGGHRRSAGRRSALHRPSRADATRRAADPRVRTETDRTCGYRRRDQVDVVRGSGRTGPKYAFAALLAAALAYVAVRTGDRVALDFFGGQGARPIPPRAGRDAFERVVTALEDVEPDGDLSQDRGLLEQALGSAQRSARRGAIQVVLTDLLDLPAGSLEASRPSPRAAPCSGSGAGPAERDFPFEGRCIASLEGTTWSKPTRHRRAKATWPRSRPQHTPPHTTAARRRLLSCSTTDSPDLLVEGY